MSLQIIKIILLTILLSSCGSTQVNDQTIIKDTKDEGIVIGRLDITKAKIDQTIMFKNINNSKEKTSVSSVLGVPYHEIFFIYRFSSGEYELIDHGFYNPSFKEGESFRVLLNAPKNHAPRIYERLEPVKFDGAYILSVSPGKVNYIGNIGMSKQDVDGESLSSLVIKDDYEKVRSYLEASMPGLLSRYPLKKSLIYKQ